MKDWMKQIRDITYDIEDCVDDSGNRIHGLRTGMPCYFLANTVYEVLTWWPRRDIAAKISVLRMRAQQIGERRDRYGVVNPADPGPSETPSGKAARFDVADNQAGDMLQLVATKNPVGVEEHLGKLDSRVTCIVGFGGVGKTAIATALYRNFGEGFGHRAVVTVSQSSDLEAIVRNIRDQFKPQTGEHGDQQKACSEKKNCPVSAVMAAIRCGRGTSEQTREMDLLRKDIVKHLNGNRYLVLIDDVWSAPTLDSIINSLPENENSRIIVTTRFHDVASTRREGDIRRVEGLIEEKSRELFMQAFLKSRGSKNAIALPQAPVTNSKSKEESSKQGKYVPFPDQVWKMCKGLPLAIVTMAGHVACNPLKSHKEWVDLCNSLFPGKDDAKELTKEEAAKIVSHCYSDMPAEIRTCSLYLSIFPKGCRISRKRLTRRWIAESFVCEKEGLNVEDVA